MSHAPEFVSLKDELCALSPDFRKWWKSHGIRAKPAGVKSLLHRTRGRLALRYFSFQSNDNPDLRLVLYCQESESTTPP